MTSTHAKNTYVAPQVMDIFSINCKKIEKFLFALSQFTKYCYCCCRLMSTNWAGNVFKSVSSSSSSSNSGDLYVMQVDEFSPGVEMLSNNNSNYALDEHYSSYSQWHIAQQLWCVLFTSLTPHRQCIASNEISLLSGFGDNDSLSPFFLHLRVWEVHCVEF